MCTWHKNETFKLTIVSSFMGKEYCTNTIDNTELFNILGQLYQFVHWENKLLLTFL
jgi:hypothetical protein